MYNLYSEDEGKRREGFLDFAKDLDALSDYHMEIAHGQKPHEDIETIKKIAKNIIKALVREWV